MAGDCIFCKIASGAIPALTLFADEAAVAFLDIGPLAPGHTLLIPRAHYSNLSDMPADAAARLASLLPRLVFAVQRATGCTGVNVLQNNGRSAGQIVEHVHIHVIPRTDGDGLGFRWNAGKYGVGQAEALQAQLKAAL